MRLGYCFPLFLCIVSITASNLPPAPSKPTPTEPFGNVWQLDSKGDYWLFWNTNSTHVTFETHVKTKGYVGFGLSSNGKMFPTDVVVGWVDSTGATHFKDCHTTGHSIPIIDTSQDWFLLRGKEDNFGTVLTFTRKLDTCDEKDFIITDNTIKVIYSYHPDDPASFSSLPWHGAERRGTKSMMLLSSVKSNEMVLPSDAEHFDLLHDNFHVPANKDTTYQCRVFKIPPKTKKHHLIRIEPIVTPGNELHVHHIVVYTCRTASDADVGRIFECYGGKPKKFQNCFDEVFVWAIGGSTFDFPAEAGYPFYGPDDPQYLIMETHFDNPTLKSGIFDSSGFRLTITPTLRQHDAGVIEVGAFVDNSQFIPPYEKEFISKSYCHVDCFKKALKSPTASMKIFNVFLHSHLLGVGIKARHFRGNKELAPLAVDENYDFDYQDNRILNPEREIKMGDNVAVECTYDSSRRTKPTYGGLPTTSEMCLAFLYYYPKVDFTFCLSKPLYNQLAPVPWHAVQQMNSWNWKDQGTRDRFKNILKNSTYQHMCFATDKQGNFLTIDSGKFLLSEVEPEIKYTPPARNCDSTKQ